MDNKTCSGKRSFETCLVVVSHQLLIARRSFFVCFISAYLLTFLLGFEFSKKTEYAQVIPRGIHRF